MTMRVMRASDDQVDQLLAVSDDHDADVIRAMAIRAGLRWLCSCGWVNSGGDQHCEDCGREKQQQ